MIVEIVEFMSEDTPCCDDNFVYFQNKPGLGVVWHVRTVGRRSKIPLHDPGSGEINFVTDSPWPDKWLRPFQKFSPDDLEDVSMLTDPKAAIHELDKVDYENAPKLLYKLKMEGTIIDYEMKDAGFAVKFPSAKFVYFIRSPKE